MVGRAACSRTDGGGGCVGALKLWTCLSPEMEVWVEGLWSVGEPSQQFCLEDSSVTSSDGFGDGGVQR